MPRWARDRRSASSRAWHVDCTKAAAIECTVIFDMTHNQTLAALDRFEATVGQLSRTYPHEVDFWPAFATHANELEATSPLDFRDYVRDSIVRMLRRIGRLPATN